LFEANVIVSVEIIEAYHLIAAIKQCLGCVITDKACCAGD
jgi:hypothetical protein